MCKGNQRTMLAPSDTDSRKQIYFSAVTKIVYAKLFVADKLSFSFKHGIVAYNEEYLIVKDKPFIDAEDINCTFLS